MNGGGLSPSRGPGGALPRHRQRTASAGREPWPAWPARPRRNASRTLRRRQLPGHPVRRPDRGRRTGRHLLRPADL